MLSNLENYHLFYCSTTLATVLVWSVQPCLQTVYNTAKKKKKKKSKQSNSAHSHVYRYHLCGNRNFCSQLYTHTHTFPWVSVDGWAAYHCYTLWCCQSLWPWKLAETFISPPVSFPPSLPLPLSLAHTGTCKLGIGVVLSDPPVVLAWGGGRESPGPYPPNPPTHSSPIHSPSPSSLGSLSL